jgi:hypothetical protein
MSRSRKRRRIAVGVSVVTLVTMMANGCSSGTSSGADPQDTEIARACKSFATLVNDVNANDKAAIKSQLADVQRRATTIVNREIAARAAGRPPPKWSTAAEHMHMAANFIAGGQISSSATVLQQCDTVPQAAQKAAGYKPAP